MRRSAASWLGFIILGGLLCGQSMAWGGTLLLIAAADDWDTGLAEHLARHGVAETDAGTTVHGGASFQYIVASDALLTVSGEATNKAEGGLAEANSDVEELCGRVDAVIALGADAGKLTIQRCRPATVIGAIPKAKADPLLESARRDNVTALYLDANPARHLELIARVTPRIQSVGVLISPARREAVGGLEPLASDLGLSIIPLIAENDEAAVKLLRRNLNRLDGVLLFDDPTVVNAWSLRPILIMTIRRYLPTFGGRTKAYVDAGITAAVVADRKGWAAQLLGMVRSLASGGEVASAHPENLQVVVNERVARSLSVSIPIELDARSAE